MPESIVIPMSLFNCNQQVLLQSPKCEIVANSHKAERKMPFGLKSKSPKEKEKNASKREKRLSMCEFGQDASPKEGVVGDDEYINFEHELHA